MLESVKEIHTVIIDEDICKLGYGSQLLLEIEQRALEKKCYYIKINTISFESLGFYEKHGYRVFGCLENGGRNNKHYYLIKDLRIFNSHEN